MSTPTTAQAATFYLLEQLVERMSEPERAQVAPAPQPSSRRHPLRFLGEIALDAVHALSVPDRYGRWNLHRWETR